MARRSGLKRIPCHALRRGAVVSGAGLLTVTGLLFASLAVASPSDERLTVLAASSVRPAGCGKALRVWSRAHEPQTTQLCGILLRASARLAQDPKEARALATEAARLAPERAEPLVLEGRALLALGEFEQAAARFKAAEKIDPRAAESPVALLAAARADVHVGEHEAALNRYRRLIPRSHLLANPREQQRALLEAAMIAQWVSPELLAESRAYAAEARRQGQLFYVNLAYAVLALVLERQGRREEARAAAQQAGGPGALDWLFRSEPQPRGQANELMPIWPLAEREALQAVLAEAVDAELAQQGWRQYLHAVAGTAPAHLVEHARQRAGATNFDPTIDD